MSVMWERNKLRQLFSHKIMDFNFIEEPILKETFQWRFYDNKDLRASKEIMMPKTTQAGTSGTIRCGRRWRCRCFNDEVSLVKREKVSHGVSQLRVIWVEIVRKVYRHSTHLTPALFPAHTMYHTNIVLFEISQWQSSLTKPHLQQTGW